MSPSRRAVLASVFAAVAFVTALVLFEVFGTVFFAMTVAYVLLPVQRAAERRGVPTWWAAVATTAVGFLGVVAIFAPILAVLYLRRGQLLSTLRALPDTVAVELGGFAVTLSLADLQVIVAGAVRAGVPAAVRMVVPLTVKAGLFLIVLFALLIARDRARRAALSVVPLGYHDVVAALVGRVEETLYAIYVLQAATGAATFLIALPIFRALGYGFPFSIAVVAGVLQFLPIVGPSILIGAIAVYHLAVGQPAAAALVVLVAGPLVAVLPDLLVRVRLARRTAHMPGSLYFVGFTGGTFSLGPIGIVAGPVVVALFDEALSLLAAELDGAPDTALADELGGGSEPPADDGDGPSEPAADGDDRPAPSDDGAAHRENRGEDGP